MEGLVPTPTSTPLDTVSKRRNRRQFTFALVLALLVLEIGARIAPHTWWETGLFGDHWLDARIIRSIARSTPIEGGSASSSALQDNQVDPGPMGLLGEHRYNREGYRGSNWEQHNSDTSTRVALLGDSRIFGLYVDVDETLSATLSEHDDLEALNFGVTGAGTFEALDYIVEDALQTQPDVAILLFDINPSVLSLSPASEWSRRSSVAQVLRGSALLRRGEMLLLHALHGREGREPSVPEDEYLNQYRAIIDALLSGGTSRVIVLVGATILEDRAGVFEGHRYDRYRSLARQAAREAQVEAIEVEPLLAEMKPNEAYRGIGIHWSPEAIKRIASAISRQLSQPPSTLPSPSTQASEEHEPPSPQDKSRSEP
jgi:hypothetical protein